MHSVEGKSKIFGDQKVFVGQYEFSDDDYYNIALGEGQFGTVYKIEDRKNSKLQFAVKVIDIEKFKMQTKKIKGSLEIIREELRVL